MSPRQIFALGLAAVLFFGIWVTGYQIFESIDADEILVVQSPISGDLTWYVTAGIKWQGFGKVTTYKKRSIYRFDTPTTVEVADTGLEGKPVTRKIESCKGIDVRFNDGGHGSMCGSIQFDMPLDVKNLTAIHTRFGSQDAVQRQLIETITGKSVYLSGPLMSSRESYAEKRNDLIFYVEDQIQHGVYKTRQREVRVKDQLTGQDKTATVVEIRIGGEGKPERQEEAVLGEFGIKAFNFVITRLPYDPEVERQIKQQQQIAMDVQTSIADAKKAEQRTITVAEQGKADAAKAKWEQEVIKAKAVTEAEQKLRVSELDAKAAEQKKREHTLLGEGEAARKRLVMEADGALQPKLDTLLKINEAYAKAIGEYQGNWVPQFVSGGGTSANRAGSGAQEMIDLLTAQTARQLGVDLGVAGLSRTAKEKSTPAKASSEDTRRAAGTKATEQAPVSSPAEGGKK